MAERDRRHAVAGDTSISAAPSAESSFFSELKRHHVVRAGIIYIAAVWALAQGISQLSPAFGLSDRITLWFVIACAIGFPFWLAFAWYFKFTAHGIERESEVAEDKAAIQRAGRKLDYWIIGIMAVAVVLFLTNVFVTHREVTIKGITLASPAAVAVPAKSVAVLPFKNLGGDSGQEYFSDDLSEDLVTALSQFAGLKVISSHSSFGFRNSTGSAAQIGAELGVAYLLAGSVQREGGQVRINASLVNAADGSTLWSHHYDRPYKGLFALQDDITVAVANALKAKLLTASGAVIQSDRPPGNNLEAYNDYLKGVFYSARRNAADYRKAVVQFTAHSKIKCNFLFGGQYTQ
ncbi:MAG: hypothetical protein ACRESR_06665, partial [Gammaproteobacteria bacterium]